MVVAIFGISGSGKTFLIRTALQEGLSWKHIAALTTRPKRYGIDEHLERIFLNEDEFKQKLDQNELCFVNQVYGYSYAYYRKDLLENDVIIETHYREYKELYDMSEDVFSVYIRPNSLEAAYARIKSRVSEEKDKWNEICEESRILDAMKTKGAFDFTLVNNYTEVSKDKFLEIMNKIKRGK